MSNKSARRFQQKSRPSAPVPDQPRHVVAALTPQARQDIRDISRWSELQFGTAAAVRYRALLIQAVRDLEADPSRPGVKDRSDLAIKGVRTYHLSYSRSRAGQPGVKQPRHFLLYRSMAPGFIEIARILHDSCDLARHLPTGYGTET